MRAQARFQGALLILAAALIIGVALIASAQDGAQQEAPATPSFPPPTEGQYRHTPPTLDELPEGPLADSILRGWEIFNETQKFKGVYTYSDMTCASCHMGEGAVEFAAPVWPAATTLPAYRGKNWRVNSLEDRISDCFAYSMNGVAPAMGSDDMTALVAYHTWMAQGAPMGEGNIYGRGYGTLPEAELEPDYARGQTVFENNCAVCHGADGQGQRVGEEVVFPPLWGDGSYNWGAGMTRIPTAAAFIYNNMPLGQPHFLSQQEAWDVALFMNSHERPQDPRYTGDVAETREKHSNFHSLTMYGQEVNGVVLGDHDNTGAKPFLRPDTLLFEPPSPAED